LAADDPRACCNADAIREAIMRRSASTITFAVVLSVISSVTAAQPTAPPAPVYYPGATWEKKDPAEAGINAPGLKEAIDFAIASETKASRDLIMNHYQTFGREPFGYAIGPIKERGDPTGMIVHHGYFVAQWGDPNRVDMTHSVTESMLSSVVGVALDRGMIRSLNDPVKGYVGPV
jgi:hypothetical protein